MNEEMIEDLDKLVPPPRKIKINGKIIECYPLSVTQLITVAKLQERLMEVKTEDEIMPLIRQALGPVIPALNDEDFVLHFTQMNRLIAFAQEISTALPKNENKEYTDPKKKENLAEESPSSSGSTQDIP